MCQRLPLAQMKSKRQEEFLDCSQAQGEQWTHSRYDNDYSDEESPAQLGALTRGKSVQAEAGQ